MKPILFFIPAALLAQIGTGGRSVPPEPSSNATQIQILQTLKQMNVELANLRAPKEAVKVKVKPEIRIRPARTITVEANAVPDITVAPFQLVTVAIGEKELIRSIDGGDSADWLVKKAADKSRYLTIKMKTEDMRSTTITVFSDRDTPPYTFRLVPSEAESDSKVFVEPDNSAASGPAEWIHRSDVTGTEQQLTACREETVKVQEEASKEKTAATTQVSDQMEVFRAKYPTMIHFAYEWDKTRGEKLGVTNAYDDGVRTIIFAKAENAPALYEANGKDKVGTLIRFKYADGIYTVPKVLHNFYLEGSAKGQRVDFTRVD